MTKGISYAETINLSTLEDSLSRHLSTKYLQTSSSILWAISRVEMNREKEITSPNPTFNSVAKHNLYIGKGIIDFINQ